MVLFSPQADIEQKTQLESKRLVNSSTTPFFPNKKTCNPLVGIRQRPQELASSRHSRLYTRRTGQSTRQLFQRTPRSAIRRACGSYRLRRPSERVDVSLASFQNVHVRCHIVPRLPALSDWRRRGVKKVVWCRVAKVGIGQRYWIRGRIQPSRESHAQTRASMASTPFRHSHVCASMPLSYCYIRLLGRATMRIIRQSWTRSRSLSYIHRYASDRGWW